MNPFDIYVDELPSLFDDAELEAITTIVEDPNRTVEYDVGELAMLIAQCSEQRP